MVLPANFEVKLYRTKNILVNNNLIIWDADTIPIKKIKFFNNYN